MNLNKSDREAFVRAVMQDVPEINYLEQAQKLIETTLYNAAPEHVRKVWDESKKGGEYWLGQGYIATPRYIHSYYGLAGRYTHGVFKASFPEVYAQVEEMSEKYVNQRQTRNELEAKLTGVITSCRTLKQAKERLPEFEKYLPKERGVTGVSNLPAISNLVADLTKLGWPKDAPQPVTE